MSWLLRITRALVACTIFIAVPAPTVAQDIDTMPVPLAELSAGYALMQNTNSDERYPGGWYFSSAVNVSHWFGIVGEASGSYKTEDSMFEAGRVHRLAEKFQVYTFMGGGRFFHKTGRVVPFGQLLAGVATHRLQQTTTIMGEGPGTGTGTWSSSSTAFALQPGGGITVYLAETVGVRVAGDYRVTIDIHDDDVINEFRFLTGFTFQWGSR